MKHKHSLLQRALSIVLSFAVVFPASLALIGDSGKAQAASTKASISVLSIEPTDEHKLTTTMVAGWGYTGTVTITYMSTMEFIGSIKDLEENYDLIYVGNSVSANGAFSNELPGNYIYANIGAEHQIRSDAVGLTDAEYISNSTFMVPGKTYYKLRAAQNTRYSGNDLTPIALEKLNDYAAAGHPVIFASGLVTGYPASTAATFTANITSSQSYINAILTATPTKTSGASLPSFTPTYQWYKASAAITGAVFSTYTATATDTYYCKITYTIGSNVSTATSKSYKVTITQPVVTYNGIATVGSATFTSNGNKTYKYNVAVSCSAGVLTVTPSKNSGSTGDSANYTYQWYNSSNALTGVNTDATYTVPTTIGTSSYYCNVGATKVNYGSSSYPVLTNTRGKTQTAKVVITGAVVAVVSGSTGTAGTISKLTATPFAVNETYVDNCSNIYAFMHTFFNGGINGYENVMSSAYIYKSTLLSYINLSDPVITLTETEKPKVYTDMSGPYLLPGATLSYSFSITNDTETDLSTEYNCNLYIDSDANGKYSADEMVVTSSNLVANTPCVVTYPLPADKAGIIPWKLEVVKATNANVHASVSDYTRVKGTAKTINILQINTGRTADQAYGSTGNSGDMSWIYGGLPLDNTGEKFTSSTSRTDLLFLISQVAEDYGINIQTVTTTAVNNISTKSIVNQLVTNASGGHDSYANIDNFLNSYDMVLIGIDNNYNELSKETAEALASYLENNPILFTHNPSSFNNVPQVYLSPNNTNYSVDAANYFGYYFNMFLRNPLGLDRYGVADDEYGHTIMSNPNLTRGGVQATESGIVASNDYTSMDGTQINALLDAKYSIAYEPGSNTDGTGGTPIVTTQGFSNYTSGPNYVSDEYWPNSTQAWQVNQGQITSYPFDLNPTPQNPYVPITSTQPLFYQLNMNSDNVVVWYCLNNNDLAYNRYDPNDVTNDSYLYRSGNATYSGFGQNTFNLGIAEAKLFVNTIIAASHASHSSRVAPTVTFSDSTGGKSLNNYLMPSDSRGVLTTTGATSTDRYLYFKVTDTSGGNKQISASFSYGDEPSTIPIDTPTIYDSSNNIVNTATTSLVSDAVYHVKIDAVWANLPASYISQNIANGITLNIKATTAIGGASPLFGNDSLKLRTFALFTLS